MDFYHETRDDSAPFRRAYLESVEAYLDRRNEECEDVRREHGEWILSHRDEARKELIRMLGRPLTEQRPAGIPAAKKTLLSHGNGVTVYRMEIEVMEGSPSSGFFSSVTAESVCRLSLHSTAARVPRNLHRIFLRTVPPTTII